MKPFYFSPKWQSSGLPIEFFCVTAGFQRRGSPSGIFFYVIHFVDTQFREILVCFIDTKIMGFAAIAKWNHFIFLQNDGLPGLILNSFV